MEKIPSPQDEEKYLDELVARDIETARKKREWEESRQIPEDTKLFETLPSSEVTLMANELARPDGFAKTLITGALASSEELGNKIGPDFIKTHRGYYHSLSKSKFGNFGGHNNYLSFNIGRPQKMYRESDPSVRKRIRHPGGLGFVMPAEKLLARGDVSPSWGVDLKESAEKLKNTPASEKGFEKYYDLTGEEYFKVNHSPKKDDLPTMVNLARKSGTLQGGDQFEVNMHKTGEEYPRLPLEQMIILIPERQREAFTRYLGMKIKQCAKYADKIKEVFGVDVTELTPEKVLEKYKNIYWYPQEDINEAVDHLSVHPEEVEAFTS